MYIHVYTEKGKRRDKDTERKNYKVIEQMRQNINI